MGRDTSIAWAHHTFNGVHGCAHATLVDGSESPGCQNCYAEKGAKRNPKTFGIWGEEGTRVLAADSAWEQLGTWHRAAVREGALRRVFCYSIGDVFESPRKLANADVCAKGRTRLFAAIERLCPVNAAVGLETAAKPSGLIFLLLTKRPENVKRMVPPSWLVENAPPESRLGWPQHVWLGASVENQPAADERVPHLLGVPGVPVRFLSLEPLLERVNLRQWIDRLGWLIPGGEGLGKRPCDLAWIRDIRDQGKAAGVPVFVKQMGANPITTTPGEPRAECARIMGQGWRVRLEHPKGEDPDEWPEDLRVREVPEVRL